VQLGGAIERGQRVAQIGGGDRAQRAGAPAVEPRRIDAARDRAHVELGDQLGARHAEARQRHRHVVGQRPVGEHHQHRVGLPTRRRVGARATRSCGELGQELAGPAGPLAAGVELEVALEVAAGLAGAADPGQREAEVVVRVGELRRGLTHPAQLGDRQLGLAAVVEEVAEVVAGLGLAGIVGQRLLVQRARASARSPAR
jgi:hypothetical protein